MRLEGFHWGKASRSATGVSAGLLLRVGLRFKFIFNRIVKKLGRQLLLGGAGSLLRPTHC